MSYIITHPDDGAPARNTHITVPQSVYQRSNLKTENIPQGLQERDQWVVWRYVETPSGELKKLPFQPHYTGSMARVNIPSDWSTFEKALEVLEKNPTFDGIGYVFSADDPYVGFDYDGCLDPETGELHDAVNRQIENLGSYTEISPSGKGLKAIAQAKKPEKPGIRCSTKKTPWGDEFAMYEHSRLFTLTSRVFGGYREIRDAQDACSSIYNEMFPEDEPVKQTQEASEDSGEALSSEELTELALKSKNGERFRRHHFEGDTTGYPSRSEADFAHLADLCFWTGGDEERMVELFFRSALYLPEKGIGYVRRSARKARRVHRGGFFKRRKKERPAEVLKLVEELERHWWDEPFPGIGGKTDASFRRALIREGKRIGTIQPGEGLRVSISILQLSEIVGCHPNTIINATKRAKAAGILRKDNYSRKGEDSGAFILLDPRHTCVTPKDTLHPMCHRGTTNVSRPPVAGLKTKHYRWRSLVGKGGEQILCAYEAFGPQTPKEAAERLGWSRPRDLKGRHLNKLVELGLLEDRGGVHALPGDYRERQEQVDHISYSTVQERVKRERSTEGLWVWTVKESGSVASEAERRITDIERNKRKRQAFRYHLEERRRARDCQCEEDREIMALLNDWSDERAEADGTISELAAVAWPEVVDGIVLHGPECACPWCGDEPPGEKEVA